ncbi:hypothetical protein L7F22_019892 [Adiantum nelumboides]|nr:hypothetical protein [Adiantum nelumboides]
MTAINGDSNDDHASSSKLKLRKEPAYWFEYDTNVKARWTGRKLIEVLVTEFRDRSTEYYQWAIHSGKCRINGERAEPHHILKMSDKIQHLVHRHEPAVTADPIRILERDDEAGRLVVVKPGSIPVHATGRYTKNTLIHMLQEELNIPSIQTSNRLDRLTSGILVCTTRKDTARTLSEQFAMGKVRKAYVCRVRGQFPEKEVTVEEPLLQCDRQSGTSIVHPLGKHSETIFNRLSYDPKSNTSVVYCRPITGRTHQIRVHSQYIGHPIVNDPIYAHRIWDKHPPTMFTIASLKQQRWKVEPGSALNVWGSPELDEVVATLKMAKDDNDDWARWKDEVLFGQMLKEEGVERMEVEGANGESVTEQRKRSEQAVAVNGTNVSGKTHYCQECKMPLLPDPKAEDLFIYLHAIKYQTDEWTYEDQMPWWALPDWQDGTQSRPTTGSRVETGISSNATMPPAFGLVGRGEKVEREYVELPEIVPINSVPESIPKLNLEGDSSHPSVVFEIFGGMEDFAAAHIKQQICSAFNDSETSLEFPHQLYTGHVSIPAGEWAAKALQVYREGYISCAKTAYIQIAAPKMPSNILTSLADEKLKLYEARSIIAARRKKGEENGDGLAEVSASGLDGQLTPAEGEFMEALKAAWDSCEDGRERAKKIWQDVHGKYIDTDRKPRFRASCDRRGYSLPTLTTIQIEKDLGSWIWWWLNGDPDLSEGDWEVNLLQSDLEIVFKLLAGHEDGVELEPHWATNPSNVPGRFAFLIPIEMKQSIKHRPQLPADLAGEGTVLARFRAHTLATALPLDTDLLKPGQNSVRIWEPCAGTGSVAIEMAVAFKKRGIKSQIFASDVFAAEVERGHQMVALCGEFPEISLAKVDASKINEALLFMEEESSLDGIVTDLPWGRRSLNHQAISKLYPAMLQVFYRMLKPGACVLLMTAEQNNLIRAAKAHEAESRRRGYEWFLNVEQFSLTPCINGNVYDPRIPKEAPTDEQRSASVRTVHCGYYVSLVLLRKVPLIV